MTGTLLDHINHYQNRSKRRKHKGSFEATLMDTIEEGATVDLRESLCSRWDPRKQYSHGHGYFLNRS